MEYKKYELLEEYTIEINGKTLYRVKAVKAFGKIKEGELGGYIETFHNLSDYGDATVCDDARAYDDASIYDDPLAKQILNAISRVYDAASIYDDLLAKQILNAKFGIRAYDDKK